MMIWSWDEDTFSLTEEENNVVRFFFLFFFQFISSSSIFHVRVLALVMYAILVFCYLTVTPILPWTFFFAPFYIIVIFLICNLSPLRCA